MHWRTWLRWAGLAGACAVLLWLGPAAARDYRDRREALVNDPSAAELYEIDFYFDVGGLVVGMGAGLLVYFFFRTKKAPS